MSVHNTLRVLYAAAAAIRPEVRRGLKISRVLNAGEYSSSGAIRAASTAAGAGTRVVPEQHEGQWQQVDQLQQDARQQQRITGQQPPFLEQHRPLALPESQGS